jgi:transposase
LDVEVEDIMEKKFRDYQPEQLMLMPPAINDWLPKEHVVHFISDVVEYGLDLSVIFNDYTEARGQPPYHPAMMTKVWIYGYMRGVRSSRKLERALHEDVGFRVLSGNQQPDFWTLAAFRRRHYEALGELFPQIVELAVRAGLVPLKHAATDGTKIRANASKHRAMSYGRMDQRAEELRAEVEAYLDDVEANDQRDAERYGPQKRGDELPEHLRTKQERIEAIKQAKAELEARARARAEAAREKRRAQAEAEGRNYRPRKSKPPKPRQKDQYNFTDPESRIMRNSDKAFMQGYNGQATVDADTQLIVAADLTNQAADSPHFPSLLEQVRQNVGRDPDEASADSGYYADENLNLLAKRQIEAFIPPNKIKHNQWYRETVPPGVIQEAGSRKERMKHKLHTARGRETYQKRQTSVEPVFGQIKAGLDFRQLMLRGQQKGRSMWRFVCGAHNLWKLFRAGINVQAITAQG